MVEGRWDLWEHGVVAASGWDSAWWISDSGAAAPAVVGLPMIDGNRMIDAVYFRNAGLAIATKFGQLMSCHSWLDRRSRPEYIGDSADPMEPAIGNFSWCAAVHLASRHRNLTQQSAILPSSISDQLGQEKQLHDVGGQKGERR